MALEGRTQVRRSGAHGSRGARPGKTEWCASYTCLVYQMYCHGTAPTSSPSSLLCHIRSTCVRATHIHRNIMSVESKFQRKYVAAQGGEVTWKRMFEAREKAKRRKDGVCLLITTSKDGG